MSKKPLKKSLSPARLAACLASIRKAQEANRRNPLSPARRAALKKATEANRRNFRLTRARRRAMGINIRKAQKASVEKFQMTEARRRANALSIRKALATPRTPESYARSRFNHLRHGLTVRNFEETLRRLGEDPKEYAALRSLLERAFAPEDDIERRVVEHLTDALARRLQLYRAQARYETLVLKQSLGALPRKTSLTADESSERADLLLDPILLPTPLIRFENRLLRRLGRLLAYLLRKRVRRDPHLLIHGRISRKELDEIEGRDATGKEEGRSQESEARSGSHD